MVKGPLIHTVYGNSQVLRVESDLSTRVSCGWYGPIVIKYRRMPNQTVPFLHWEGFLCQVCIIQQKSWLKPINADRGCPVIYIDCKMFVGPSQNFKWSLIGCCQ
ncbi:hypothetical protein NPIL_446971 [Nephila pilipes]|uniref:Uncharacterized protein n=1 Tax=Nephila pilipes TaxID=299642 RepID=A0A8X6R1X9_NEPPI|nr:hypothetical protein NPIL_446971 [Nephila pilipes]